MDDDKRRSARLRTLKGARVVFNNKASTVDCRIRNLSEGGARVQMERTDAVPDAFELRFDDGKSHDCVVRWRTATEMGVEFV